MIIWYLLFIFSRTIYRMLYTGVVYTHKLFMKGWLNPICSIKSENYPKFLQTGPGGVWGTDPRSLVRSQCYTKYHQLRTKGSCLKKNLLFTGFSPIRYDLSWDLPTSLDMGLYFSDSFLIQLKLLQDCNFRFLRPKSPKKLIFLASLLTVSQWELIETPHCREIW